MIDITVLTLDFQLTEPKFTLVADEQGIFGQDVYFLGFPYGLGGQAVEMKHYFPIPFIKKATLSCMVNDPSGARIFYLDGFNNPGFSGGPVVFSYPNKLYEMKVLAVVSGYKFDPQPVFIGDQETSLVARHNTGIIITYGISHAIELIQANPIGFVLPSPT